MYEKISELNAAIHDTIRSLDGSTGDAKEALATARVKARLFQAHVRALQVQLDHATRTSRLKKGSALLPDMDLGEIRVGDIAVDLTPEEIGPPSRTRPKP